MKFTGERYVPSEGGDIRQEHLHRYAWCSSLASGKQVLDIACGEGYGSAMLARQAESVIGVDIASEAVEHAAATYRSFVNLEFRVGDAAKIPLDDNSVDLVVSFETIEHHDRHTEMVDEIRRVLRRGGLLVISSPNRDIYSERAGYHNEFHVKELNFAEFDKTLRRRFPAVRYFGQRLAVGSSIFSLEASSTTDSDMVGLTDTGSAVVERAAILPDPVYFIAVASASEQLLPNSLRFSVLLSEADDLYTHHIEVASWARKLNDEVGELRDKFAKSVRDGEEVSAWAQALAKSAQDAQSAWQAEKAAREAAEQRAEVQSGATQDAQSAWQAEKAVREAAEQRAKVQSRAAQDAQSAWQAEKAAREAAEQRAEVQSRATQDAQSAWQAEKMAHAAAERRVGDTVAMLQAVRGEAVKQQARLVVLEQQRAELDLIKASRSWRWTRPLRFVLRTLRHGGLSELDRRQWHKRFGRAAIATSPDGVQVVTKPLADAPVGATTATATTTPRQQAAALRLVAQQSGRYDYFVWSVIDWHFRIQRPQHLSRELAAAGHRVFYISNNFADAPDAGFAVEPLDPEGRLFQVHLNLAGAPQIYHAAPNARQHEQLRASLGALLAWTKSRGAVSFVQHPYWLEVARSVPDSRLVYDCMDHHGGFSDNDADVLAREGELMRAADLLITTSDWLYHATEKYNVHRVMVRNACEFEHFAQHSQEPFRDLRGRKVIGYYGAIAEWFDLDLVEKIAQRFDDCLVLLVGNDTAGAGARLGRLPNVQFTGEVPYAALPAYLDGFNVCMLPFHIIPLTLATNPVKVYEYLSAGKEVVSVDLPELRQFGDLVRIAEDHAVFLAALDSALKAVPGGEVVERRQTFAAEQTWSHRVTSLQAGVAAIKRPRVSVIVVTYNNLDMTRACLDSLERLSDYDDMQVIVVDNASTDDTPAFLREWAQGHADRKIILNSDNLGFAAGNNCGLAAADGEYLVLLNNDTYVTPGWVATLVAHLERDNKLGMVGPVTNNIGNEARIDINYTDMDAMLVAAADYTCRHVGQLLPLRTAAFFCVMFRRSVYEKVGPLDEAFGIGFFEDDDYCRRVEQAGWGIACAEDVFIHHHLSASFNKLKQEKRQALFERNKAIYEAKWGPWVPHEYRGA